MVFLRYYLWIAPHVLLGLVLVGLLRRELQKQLPLFLGYVVFELILFAALITINFLSWSSALQYYWVSALGLGISASLKCGVIYELAEQLLLSRSRLAPLLRSLLRGVAAALLLIAVGFSATFPGAGIDRARKIFHALDFGTSVMLVGFLVVLLLFAEALYLSWRSRTVGIVLGFGVLASVGLTTSALRPHLGQSGSIVIDLIQMAAYHICVLVWLAYLFMPERVPQFTGRGLQKTDIESWDQELQRMVRR